MTVRQKLLVTVFGNPGGEGKTVISRTLEAFTKLDGQDPHVVCADAGNGSIRRVLPESDGIDWGATPEIGARLVAHYEHKDALIVDCGASSSTKIFNIVELLLEARKEADNQERRSIAIIPVTPNKPGTVGMARESIAAFEQAGFETYVMRNNRDGSGNYLEGPDAIWEEIPHLQAGFMSVLNSNMGSWHNALCQPAAGFDYALDHIAAWFQSISRLTAFRRCIDFGENGLKHGRRGPAKLDRVVATLAGASNEAIVRNLEFTAARAALRACELSDPTLPDKVKRFQVACN